MRDGRGLPGNKAFIHLPRINSSVKNLCPSFKAAQSPKSLATEDVDSVDRVRTKLLVVAMPQTRIAKKRARRTKPLLVTEGTALAGQASS
jgi:hypothetical protein